MVQAYVWSWARNEPKMNGSAKSSGWCASLSSNSRWVSRTCTDLLFVACGLEPDASGDDGTMQNVNGDSDENWTISLSAIAGSDLANADCPTGYAAIPPRNGYANTRLWAAALGQSLWLNAPVAYS